MNKVTKLITVLTVAAVCASCCNSPKVEGNPTYDTIMTRTSVRSYSDKVVSPAQVDSLLRASMAAPSAVNKQPWRFLVVNDKSMLDSISTNFPFMKMARTAQVAIILCGDMDAAIEGDGHDYWIQDVSAATENLLLAAHSMGLGAVWCGIYPVQEKVETFARMFGMPGNIIPLSCVCIGYPAGENSPKDKWKPENVHYNTWRN